MPSVIMKRFIALALLTTAMAAVVIPAVVEPTASDKALVLRNSLAVRTPEWDGTPGLLLPRRNSLALFAVTAAFLGSVVVGACSSPFAALLGPYPCVGAVVAATVGFVISAFATVVAANMKRAIDDNDKYFNFHYPAIEGGLSTKEQWFQAYDVDFGDGLPVLVGETNCNEKWDTCHKVWYSKSIQVRDGQNHTIHRVTATPHSHDYRANGTRTSSAIKPRQTTDDDANVQENDGSTLYGGYVWEEGTEATLADLYHEGSNDQDTANDVSMDLLTIMNDENQANGKYSDEGSYCQDWASTADSAPGSLGYLWYYKDQSMAPSGSQEDALLMTCGEQSSTAAERK